MRCVSKWVWPSLSLDNAINDNQKVGKSSEANEEKRFLACLCLVSVLWKVELLHLRVEGYREKRIYIKTMCECEDDGDEEVAIRLKNTHATHTHIHCTMLVRNEKTFCNGQTMRENHEAEIRRRRGYEWRWELEIMSFVTFVRTFSCFCANDDEDEREPKRWKKGIE